MKAKRISLKDIAAELGVSVTTVSFVLNGKGREKGISEAVIEKIQNYVKEVNYKPNEVARTLRTGKSRVLVFMVEDISNIFFAKIARLIEDIAYEKGYRILFCSNENEDSRSEELIELFIERQVEGFIISPSPGIQDAVERLQKRHIPLVLFDRYFPQLPTHYVIIDNKASSYRATRHLLENGFRKIAFVTIESEQTQMKDRLKGYEMALEEQRLAARVLVVPFKENDRNNKKQLLRDFLCEPDKMDAVFFSTNYLTGMGLEVIKEEVPDKLKSWGILTFDDNSLFKIYDPSITAIAQPLKAISEQLMEILLKQISNKKTAGAFEQRVLETELIIRDSSQRR